MTDITPELIELIDQRINARLNPAGSMCSENMTISEAHRALTAAGVNIGTSTLYRQPERHRNKDGDGREYGPWLLPREWVLRRIAQHTNPNP